MKYVVLIYSNPATWRALHAEDLRGQLPQQAFDLGGAHISRPAASISARTSTVACGVRALAISTARYMVSTSISQRLASTSLDSPKGPSVTAGTPSRRATVLALVASASR